MSRNENNKQPAASPLADLLAYISEQAPHKHGNTFPPEPPETEYFQETWQRLSTRLRLEQSQLQVPENAGPLNSSQLIHRALLLMQDRSPAYLRHFLSYVDTLSWVEQLTASQSAPLAKTATALPTPKAATKPATKPATKRTRRTATKPAKKTTPQ